jgi:type VI secretion system protein ImpL
MTVPAVVLLAVPSVPRWLVVVAILVVVAALLVAAFLLRRRLRAAAEAAAEEAAGEHKELADVTRTLQLRRAFARSIRLLRSNTAGRGWRYQIPWILMMGEAGAGKRTVLRNTGLNLPLGRPREEVLGIEPGCSWWFFDRGIVLNVAGSYVLRPDGRTSDDKGWRTVLGLLRRHRPGRPIDGVVVTIPATDLVGAHAAGEEHRARLGAKADLLRRKLWSAQKMLGMRFPVYVLVTKCDEVRGFRAFADAVGERFHEEILGWSSPYALETAYGSAWVDAAFDTMAQGLHQAQLELFAEGRPLEADGVFLFPGEFAAMREPLRIYLDALFGESVYHESFFFRGLYFAGDAAGAAPAREVPTLAEDDAAGAPAGEAPRPEDLLVPPAPAAETERRPAFLKHFFERKVFAEHALARPAPRAYLERNRAVLAAQAVLVFVLLTGTAGLVWAWRDLGSGVRSLLPVLTDVAENMKEVRNPAMRAETSASRLFEEHAVELFRGMTNINVERLTNPFVPQGYFSDIHGRIRASMTAAYSRVILIELRQELARRGDALVAPPPSLPGVVGAAPAPAAAAVDAAAGPLAASPEFAALKRYVDDVTAYEEHVDLYNGLRQTADLGALGKLTKYTFGVELPAGFFQNAAYYQHALEEAEYRPIDAAALRPRALARFRRLEQAMYERVEGRELREALRALALRIDALDRRGRGGLAADGAAAFRDLLDAVNGVDRLLAAPENQFLVAEAFAVGPVVDGVLTAAEKSRMLGAGVRAEVLRQGEAVWQGARQALEATSTRITGSLLARRDGKGPLRLSPGTTALKNALEGVMALGLTGTPVRTTALIRYVPGRRLLWDDKPLQEAVKLYDDYDAFVRNEAKNFPDYLEAFVRRAAVGTLEGNIVERVARAQEFAPGPERGRGVSEADLAAEIKSLRDAMKPLSRLLDIFTRLGFNGPARDLNAVLTAQAHALLAGVDRLLADDGLYTPREGVIPRWDGRRRLSLLAFEAGDTKEVERYLDLQRERVRFLAREYAEPLVSFIAGRRVRRTPEQDRVLSRWQRILGELEKYDAKRPGNSIAALEKFILVDMDDVNSSNYLQRITARDLREVTADFFLQKRDALRRDMYRRLQVVADHVVTTEYSEIEATFNRRLAGRFPFVEGGARAARVDADADPAAIKEFFEVFDRQLKGSRQILKSTARYGVSGDRVADFLDRMEKVRAFFAPFLAKDAKIKTPAYDLDVEFRVNREREKLANQIIDWTLDVGEQRLRYRDPRKPLRWKLGDRVRLTLRFAKDSRYLPAGDATDAPVVVDEKTATYDFSNDWSLLTLLLGHATTAEDLPGLVDPRPYTLRFAIRTIIQETGSRPEVEPSDEARLFIRVTLTAPEGKEPLVLPTFPARAPELVSAARRR